MIFFATTRVMNPFTIAKGMLFRSRLYMVRDIEAIRLK